MCVLEAGGEIMLAEYITGGDFMFLKESRPHDVSRGVLLHVCAGREGRC